MRCPDRLEVGLLAVVTAHVFLVPYTKVEESFNLQAMHDFLFHTTNLTAYDHIDFPGVVPRTCIGAGVVAMLSMPMLLVQKAMQLPKLTMLYAVRITLGAICWMSMCCIGWVLSLRLGKPSGRAFLLVMALQFHLPFYMSRTLPNTFATAAMGFAIADWMDGHHPKRLISLLALATVIFRCDMLPLAGLIALHMLGTRQISLRTGVLTGCTAGTACLCLTVGMDSVFWQRWLWPEGEVLWFNTAQNRLGPATHDCLVHRSTAPLRLKSSEWGVMPFHWYFTSALPRALLGGLPLAGMGVFLEPRIRSFVVIVTAYVVLYSFLPHKEVRFLLPVLPVYNIASAAALGRIWINKHKPAGKLLGALAVILLSASVAATTVMIVVSRQNYPGGHALHQLHMLHSAGQKASMSALAYTDLEQATPVRVHIDVLPAMTGVSRFGELGLPWQYSKAEGLSPEELQRQQFTYLLTSKPNSTGFSQIGSVDSYNHLHVVRSLQQMAQAVRSGQLPVKIETLPKVFMLVNNSLTH